MERQIFADGIGQVTIIGGTVRLDLVTYSPAEKDANGQPLAVFSQRVVMSLEGFTQSAGKIQEAAEAIARMAQRPRPVSATDPLPQAGEAAAGVQVAAAAKRPFP
jgi:hypothetical protein